MCTRSWPTSSSATSSPVVPVIAVTSIPEYKQTLMERFSNPTINDQVTRICSEGSAKLPKWLLPSIVELAELGRDPKLLSLVVASWIFYFARGVDESGRALEILDARSAELIALARSSGLSPLPLLQIRSIFGEVIPANKAFVTAVEAAMQSLAREGTRATLRAYLR